MPVVFPGKLVHWGHTLGQPGIPDKEKLITKNPVQQQHSTEREG
jgi:hypothetical protein